MIFSMENKPLFRKVLVYHVSRHESQATTDQFVSPCLHFKSGAYMALKVDIWPPLPLETQTKCHLHGSLSGVSNAPPFCGNQKPPACPPKTVFLVKKRRPTCPLGFKGPAKWTPTWAYVCTKTPLHEKLLHSSKYPPQAPAPESRMPRMLPLFFGEICDEKSKTSTSSTP